MLADDAKSHYSILLVSFFGVLCYECIFSRPLKSSDSLAISQNFDWPNFRRLNAFALLLHFFLGTRAPHSLSLSLAA